MDVECKLRCVNFRTVSDHTRAFRPAFGITEISDDWYRSTMAVIRISLRTPRRAGEDFVCTWKHRGAPATSLEAPQITPERSGKNNILLGTLLVCLEIIATTYHSTIVKTHVFSLYSHLCINVSMYQCIYVSI